MTDLLLRICFHIKKKLRPDRVQTHFQFSFLYFENIYFEETVNRRRRNWKNDENTVEIMNNRLR